MELLREKWVVDIKITLETGCLQIFSEKLRTTFKAERYTSISLLRSYSVQFSRSVVSDFLRPHGLQQSTRLLCPWGFSSQENWSGFPCPPPGDLPNPQIDPRCPALQVDSLPSEPPGKPKNIGMGSLSLLQGIFLTQGSSWGLLHCRQILYQLSFQGSPSQAVKEFKLLSS